MADYNKQNIRNIEKKWQLYWSEKKTFKAINNSNKPKYYVLDMFPYPSGSGLHVGHPLGYIASDIIARHKRHKGFNVLHPMGYDAFGLPAEQYAIQTGQHPAVTTEQNIKRYREQLDNIGFSFDWDREVRTCSPEYYRWTQWIFLKLFGSWFNPQSNKAEPIESLVRIFESKGFKGNDTEPFHGGVEKTVSPFSATEWLGFDEQTQQNILMHFRLAYLDDSWVNWCPALGTVLANDEIKDGFSERGHHPVERKLMKQWSMRITAFADRLLKGLEEIDWSENIKEIQRNWIGKSEGCAIRFNVNGHENKFIEVFTTRPDTIFGVSYLTLAPELDLVKEIATPEQKELVEQYIVYAKSRSERDRQSEVKKITGVFTGAYAIHPFSGKAIPVWVGDYVLAGYGTGAVMAVPAHDTRDHAFATHFSLPIIQVVQTPSGWDITKEAFVEKSGTIIQSDFLNGQDVRAAIKQAIVAVEKAGKGEGRTNFRLRDAVFGRQRYWGEPIPIYYKNGIPYPVAEKHLPLRLPAIDKFLPTESGEPPLGRATNWNYNPEIGVVANGEAYPLELTTMPGWAGSSWYFFRYMDAENVQSFVSDEAGSYWKQVDFYLGGAEHATGHLLYARFWTKFLYDIGLVFADEPFKKLVNQGMILGENHEKMSKSKGNVVNPDDIVENYGADTLRLYEMFLGPLQDAKPWNTQGIEGVHRFLKKFWKLFHNKQDIFEVSEQEPTEKESKILHKTIKKISEDIENYSFNTSVSAFMICVNDLQDLNCNKRKILQPLTILLSPFAPHICEELWCLLGKSESIELADWPELNPDFLVENSFSYPVSVNGKVRVNINFPLDMEVSELEKAALSDKIIIKWLEGKVPKKIIVVKGRIINIVV